MRLQNRDSCTGCMAFVGGECGLNFPLARIRSEDGERKGDYKPKNKCYKPKTNDDFQKSFELTV